MPDSNVTERRQKAMRMVERFECGESLYINSDDAEECCDLDWLEAMPGGGYALTDDGRRIPREHSRP